MWKFLVLGSGLWNRRTNIVYTIIMCIIYIIRCNVGRLCLVCVCDRKKQKTDRWLICRCEFWTNALSTPKMIRKTECGIKIDDIWMCECVSVWVFDPFPLRFICVMSLESFKLLLKTMKRLDFPRFQIHKFKDVDYHLLRIEYLWLRFCGQQRPGDHQTTVHITSFSMINNCRAQAHT